MKVERASAAVQQFDAIGRFLHTLTESPPPRTRKDHGDNEEDGTTSPIGDSKSHNDLSNENYQQIREEWETALREMTMTKIDADGQKRRADNAERELDEERDGRRQERAKDLEMMEKLQRLAVEKDKVLKQKERLISRLEGEVQQLSRKDATSSAICVIL